MRRRRDGVSGRRAQFDASSEVSMHRSRVEYECKQRQLSLTKQIDDASKRFKALSGPRDIREARTIRNNIGKWKTELEEARRRMEAFDDAVKFAREASSEDLDQNSEMKYEAVIASLCGKPSNASLVVYSDHCVKCSKKLVIQSARSCAVCPSCGHVKAIGVSFSDMVEEDARIRNNSSKGKAREALKMKRGYTKRSAQGVSSSSDQGSSKRRKTAKEEVVSPQKKATTSSAASLSGRTDEYRKYLQQFEDTVPDPPQHVIQFVVCRLDLMQRTLLDSRAKHSRIGDVLKDGNYSEYAFMASRISKLLSDQPVPKLTKTTIERLVRRFEIVLHYIDRQSTRQKMMKHEYTTHKFLEQDGLITQASYFDNHKTRPVLHKEEQCFREACTELNKERAGGFDWPFTRSS